MQAALGVAAEHLEVPQALDELAEQGLVGELRGIQAVQDRQALGHDAAQGFQLCGVEAAIGVVQQQRGNHVEALQHLDDAARQQAQQHELAGGGIRALHLTVILVQQAAADQPIHIAQDSVGQLLLRPVHVQLGLQIGIEGADQTLDLLAVHPRVVQEQAGNQRGQGDQVQDVVAVPSHEHRLGLVQIENLTQSVGLPADHAHGLHMADLFGPGQR